MPRTGIEPVTRGFSGYAVMTIKEFERLYPINKDHYYVCLGMMATIRCWQHFYEGFYQSRYAYTYKLIDDFLSDLINRDGQNYPIVYRGMAWINGINSSFLKAFLDFDYVDVTENMFTSEFKHISEDYIMARLCALEQTFLTKNQKITNFESARFKIHDVKGFPFPNYYIKYSEVYDDILIPPTKFKVSNRQVFYRQWSLHPYNHFEIELEPLA